MLSVIEMSCAAGIFIIDFFFAFLLLKKSVPSSQKEEMRQFDENQKTYRWQAAYSTLFISLPFGIVCFIISLFVKGSVNCAPYFLAAYIIFTITVFLCICIWKDLFYVFSNMSMLNKKLFKLVMNFFIYFEFIVCICGICVSHSAVYIYFLLFVLSVLAIYITYSKRLKSDEESLTIDNSDFAR